MDLSLICVRILNIMSLWVGILHNIIIPTQSLPLKKELKLPKLSRKCHYPRGLVKLLGVWYSYQLPPPLISRNTYKIPLFQPCHTPRGSICTRSSSSTTPRPETMLIGWGGCNLKECIPAPQPTRRTSPIQAYCKFWTKWSFWRKSKWTKSIPFSYCAK